MYKTAKHFWAIILVVITMGTFRIFAFAEETNTTKNNTLDPSIAAIVASQLTDEAAEILTNTELYHFSTDGKDLSNQLIMQVYVGLFDMADQSLEFQLTHLKTLYTNQNYAEYLVLDEHPYIVVHGKNTSQGEKIYVSNELEKTPSYVRDILSLSERLVLNGEKCILQNFYSVIKRGAGQTVETAVYLQTDKGVFVKYYVNYDAPAQLYTEAEFVEYAAEYFAYISSYEVNYDENGELLGGGSVTFGEFVKMDWQPPVDEPEGNFPWFLVALAAVFVLAATIYMAKKKKNHTV